MKGLRRTYSYGDTITFELEPKEIRIINFDKSVRDWSALRALQERTPYTAPQPTEAKKPPKNHPTLGASATGEQNTSVEQLPGGDVQKAAPQV
jgi:hypothetical protein